MSREVRMVPKDWKHPKHSYQEVLAAPYLMGRYKSLHGGSYAKACADWDEENAKWSEGLRKSWTRDGDKWEPHNYTDGMTYPDYAGERPVAEDYMPDWPDSERTHLMMYETTSEGTPLSPAFETPEELARWLADNNASAFGSDGAPYEHWLPICKGGWAPSGMIVGNTIMSGVSGMALTKETAND